MSNLGYFQLKAAPGVWDLQLAPGKPITWTQSPRPMYPHQGLMLLCLPFYKVCSKDPAVTQLWLFRLCMLLPGLTAHFYVICCLT